MGYYDDDIDLTDEDTTPEEWAGWMYETDSGTIRYSAVHLIDDQGDPVCGARPKRGVEWLAECDSAGQRCGKCSKAAMKKTGDK